MSTHYEGNGVALHHGDCLDVLRTLPDASVDSVVTDPPYGLSFMGKAWDKPTPRAEHAACVECGNDDPTEGWLVCTDCLEALGDSAPKRPAAPSHGGRDMLGHVSANWHDKGTHSRGYADNDNAAFQQWCELWAAECLRVLKPGGHLLAFGGTRTWHRLACAVEDAGFEVRDSLAWLYGSGFPKSLDVSKAIDKRPGVGRHAEFVAHLIERREAAGLSRADVSEKVVGTRSGACWNWEHHQFPEAKWWPALRDLLDLDEAKWGPVIAEAERRKIGERTTGIGTGKGAVAYIADSENRDVTAPATDAARQWQGFGTALKPAFEPVVVARKPLIGTVAANVTTHGTGALNIDACRIEGEVPSTTHGVSGGDHIGQLKGRPLSEFTPHASGRWPANVILDEDMADVLDEQSGITKSTGGSGDKSGNLAANVYGDYAGTTKGANAGGLGDSGGASRFFYVAKAPKRERPVVDGVAHPTVKPITLMRWLVRLVTPPGGTVLEPFAGSGTTVEACLLEGFRCVAIEKGDEYLPLILERIRRQTEPPEVAELVRTVDPGAAILEQVHGQLDIFGEATA